MSAPRTSARFTSAAARSSIPFERYSAAIAYAVSSGSAAAVATGAAAAGLSSVKSASSRTASKANVSTDCSTRCASPSAGAMERSGSSYSRSIASSNFCRT